MTPLIRLYSFNRKSGASVPHAIARAWRTVRRDPFKQSNPRLRARIVVAVFFAIAFAVLILKGAISP